MDDFHVMEAIGRGKYSSVFKGRKKKSVEYLAIKSVDKSHKSKVLQEVETLQSLDHSNVLKCYDWYETGDHLWLILEYCSIGDLRTILKEDGKLPEDLVHDIALDLVNGLRYLHWKGIIYCDLKPSNILLDGGCTKLGGFGLSRKSRNISKTPSSLRGSPSYMAPELFRDGGAPSYASDIWALGCVLYECYAGRPPFIGKELTQLVNSILNDPTPCLPGNPSRPFADLVTSLLIKDPTDRIAYWRTRFLTEDNPQNKTPRDISFSELNETPKNRKIQQKDVSSSNTAEGVDLLRLSRIAKSNLQRENDKENPRLQNVVDEDDTTDVEIESTDMELDFTEYTEEDETQGPPAATPTVDESEVPATPPTAAPDQPKTQRTVDDDDSGGVAVIDQLPCVLWHQSDLSVQHVINPSENSNKQVDVVKSHLPFKAIPPSDSVKLQKDELKAVTESILAVLVGKGRTGEKKKAIRYLEMLISTNAYAANILTNSSIMPVLVGMLKHSRESAFCVELASLVGLLIRHSSSINDDHLSESGIFGALNERLVDSHVKVKRFSMAALCELLCHISTTQNNQSKAATNLPLDTTSEETKTSSGVWQDPSRLISKVTPFLREGEDGTTQLYALRTIEHVSVQGGDWSTCFNTEDVIDNLCNIFRDPGKEETTRLTAGSCLVRLVRFTPPTIIQVMEKLSFKKTAAAIAISPKQKNHKEQQICLNLLIMAGPYIRDHLPELAEVKNLVPGLVSLVEHGGEVLAGKSALLVTLLCEVGGREWLGRFFLSNLLPWIVKRLVVKEEEVYLKRCLGVFVRAVVAVIPELLADVTHQLMGTTSESADLGLFPVVPNLLQSYPFKRKLASVEVLKQLQSLLIRVTATESPLQGRHDLQESVVSALEALIQDASFVVQNCNFIVQQVLPSISTIYKGCKDEDVRFLCLTIWRNTVFSLVFNSSSSSYNKDELKEICTAHFLPLYGQLMQEDDPIPFFAQDLYDTMTHFDIVTWQ